MQPTMLVPCPACDGKGDREKCPCGLCGATGTLEIPFDMEIAAALLDAFGFVIVSQPDVFNT